MQRIILYLLFFIPIHISLAQFFKGEPSQIPGAFYPGSFYFEANYLPGDTGGTCFISYRIAYNQLVFIKENGKFYSKFSVTIEASDSLEEKLKREISEREITVSTYEQTIDEQSYVQGVVKLSLSHGNFKILSSLNDYNASKEYRQRPIFLNIGATSTFLNPILVDQSRAKCGIDSSHVLANYQGDILFSPKKYDLLIPVTDTSVLQVEMQIKNNDSLFSKITLDKFYEGTFEIEECESDIHFKMFSGKNSLRYFYIPAFNLPLKEGKLEISLNHSKSEPQVFHRLVHWFDKPRSLFKTEMAIKILKYMVDDSDLTKLKRVSDKEAYKALFDFWKQYDPTSQTAFNELMSEYYERVDYSIKNFSLVGSANGAETDRGKIYIIYGKPDNIQRIYTDSNNIKEIWTYSDNQKFVFTDRTGLGNFILSAL